MDGTLEKSQEQQLMTLAFIGHLHVLNDLLLALGSMCDEDGDNPENQLHAYQQFTDVIESNAALWQYDYNYPFASEPADGDVVFAKFSNNSYHDIISKLLSNIKDVLYKEFSTTGHFHLSQLYCLKKGINLQNEFALLSLTSLGDLYIESIAENGSYAPHYQEQLGIHKLHQSVMTRPYIDPEFSHAPNGTPLFTLNYSIERPSDPILSTLVYQLERINSHTVLKNDQHLNSPILTTPKTIGGVLSDSEYSHTVAEAFGRNLIAYPYINQEDKQRILVEALDSIHLEPLPTSDSGEPYEMEDRMHEHIIKISNLVQLLEDFRKEYSVDDNRIAAKYHDPVKVKVIAIFSAIQHNFRRGYSIVPGVEFLEELALSGVDVIAPYTDDAQSLMDIAKEALGDKNLDAQADLECRFFNLLHLKNESKAVDSVDTSDTVSLNHFTI